MVSVRDQVQKKGTQAERRCGRIALGSTFVFLHGIRLDRCKRLLWREEEADLPFGLLVTGAAVKLIDGSAPYSELRSEAGGGRTRVSIYSCSSSCCGGFTANYSNKELFFSFQGSVCIFSLSDII